MVSVAELLGLNSTSFFLFKYAFPLVFGFILLVFFLVIRRVVKRSKKIKKQIEDGTLPQSLRDRVQKKIVSGEQILNDFFSYNVLYYPPFNLRTAYTTRNSGYLYSDTDTDNSLTMTEMMYYLGFGGFTSASLKRLIGGTYTKTRGDEIEMEIKDGLFRVKLNRRNVGTIDVINKRILSPS